MDVKTEAHWSQVTRPPLKAPHALLSKTYVHSQESVFATKGMHSLFSQDIQGLAQYFLQLQHMLLLEAYGDGPYVGKFC